MKISVKIFSIVLLICLTAGYNRSEACTAVVISGKVTASGRPMMLKVRDSQEQNCDFQLFKGEKFDFIGQTTTCSKPHEQLKGVVSGYNTAGLCMASLTPGKGFAYDSMRDKRLSGGKLIFKALGRCRNITEFEQLVNEIFDSRIIIAHLIVIDAEGGAAVYEFGGKSFVKYDTNDLKACPGGFRCQTNFSFSGDPTLGHGQVRYDSAVKIMESLPRNAEGKFEFGPAELSDYFCRTFYHAERKIKNIDQIKKEYLPGEDFIIRSNTCVITAFEGARPGETPSHTILWAQLGTPTCTPSLPLILSSGKIPEYMTNSALDTAAMMRTATRVRNLKIYDLDGPKRYERFNVQACRDLIKAVRKTEDSIKAEFYPLLDAWRENRMPDTEFYESYAKQASGYLNLYKSDFAEYLK